MREKIREKKTRERKKTNRVEEEKKTETETRKGKRKASCSPYHPHQQHRLQQLHQHRPLLPRAVSSHCDAPSPPSCLPVLLAAFVLPKENQRTPQTTDRAKGELNSFPSLPGPPPVCRRRGGEGLLYYGSLLLPNSSIHPSFPRPKAQLCQSCRIVP